MKADKGDHGAPGGQILSDRGAPLANSTIKRDSKSGFDQLLSGYCQFRATLQQKCLAITGLFEGILVAAVRDLEGRFDTIKFGSRLYTLLDQLASAFTVLASLIKHGNCLANRGGILDRDLIIVTNGRKTESNARLLQCRLCLLKANSEFRGLKKGNGLPFSHDRSKIDIDPLKATGNLEADSCLLISGKSPGSDYRLRQLSSLGSADADGARRSTGPRSPIGRGLGVGLATSRLKN